MKKFSAKFLIIFICTNLALCAHAQSVKTITLKDGSVIKGEVAGLAEGVYTLKTSNLGEVRVPESEVLSIVAGEAAPATPVPPAGGQNESMKVQAQQIQASLLSDPEIMQEIQNIMQDEEIRGVLSDPDFMNAIFSYDPTKIQQSERTQYLLRNPKFQSLMEKISQKFPPR